MHIGIFSKLGAAGGSEHRCAEMANSIVRYTGHTVTLLCEKELNERIKNLLDNKVNIALHVLGEYGHNRNLLHEVDSLLIVNSDSYSFSKPEYWHGKAMNKDKPHHTFDIDPAKIRQMVFLYNFVVSPAQNLKKLYQECPDVRIICANKRFFDEISTKDKFKGMRHLPRTTLDSPICPQSVSTAKYPSEQIRIGKHSLAHGYKFNKEHQKLIERINEKYSHKVIWDFMGVPKDRIKELSRIPNVIIREAFSKSVKEYLMGIDIFLFFIDWGRTEPWSRAVAEAMMSGTPVIATDKAGNRDQVISGNNGFLCNTVDQMFDSISFLIENPEIRKTMGLNNHIYSQRFTSQKIINNYLDFITTKKHT